MGWAVVKVECCFVKMCALDVVVLHPPMKVGSSTGQEYEGTLIVVVDLDWANVLG